MAAGKVIEKGKRSPAHLLEAAEQRHRVRRRQLQRRRHRSRRDTEAGRDGRVPAGAAAAGLGAGSVRDTRPTAPKRDTYPNGCHICEVEIDPETGDVTLPSYLVVDDVGTVINPLTLAGPDPWRRGAGRSARS